jgi:hypothetical protein
MEKKLVHSQLKALQKMQLAKKDMTRFMLQEYDIYRTEKTLHIGVSIVAESTFGRLTNL